MKDKKIVITMEQWNEAGKELYGEDKNKWKFRCPSCGHVASVQEWKDIKAPEGTVAFSCIGRFIKGCKGELGAKVGPCNYAGGGLFVLNPIGIKDDEGKEHYLFAFADMTPEEMEKRFVKSENKSETYK